MRRKLVKQGAGALTLCVPKRWVSAHGLKGGDEITVSEANDDLIISCLSRPVKREVTFAAPSNDEWLIRINLNELYRLGYDTIRMQYSDKEQVRIATEVVENYLLGFEVIEDKGDVLIIDNVAEPNEDKQEVLLRRTFLLIKESLAMTIADLEAGSYGRIREMRKIAHDVGQYDNFCRRSISKKIFQEERVMFYWSFYGSLQRIQRSLLHTYEFLATQKGYRPSKAVLLRFAMLPSALEDLHEGFFKGSLSQMKRANEGSRGAYLSAQEGLLTSKGVDSVLLHQATELGRLIYVATSPALGILLR